MPTVLGKSIIATISRPGFITQGIIYEVVWEKWSSRGKLIAIAVHCDSGAQYDLIPAEFVFAGV